MTHSIRITALIILFLGIGHKPMSGQELNKTVPEKTMTLKMSGYTVADNKKFMDALAGSGYRVMYCCIPAGLVLVEAEQIITEEGKSLVISRMKLVRAEMQYTLLQGFTREMAEQECSAVRISQSQNK